MSAAISFGRSKVFVIKGVNEVTKSQEGMILPCVFAFSTLRSDPGFCSSNFRVPRVWGMGRSNVPFFLFAY